MKTITFNSQNEYLEAKAKNDAYNNASKEWMKENKTNGIPCAIAGTFPYASEVNNELRSMIEVWEFIHNIPDTYFLYINDGNKEATTWTGAKLGNVHFGNTWKDNLGGKRQAIDVFAVNGKKYHGIYYTSSGNYARIKLYKNQK